MRIYQTIPVILLALILAQGCKAPGPPPAAGHKSFMVMGTFATVSVSPHDENEIRRAALIVEETMGELDAKLSIFKPDSEISLVNYAAGRGPVEVSPATLNVLQLAFHYSELSEGAFDPTISPLMEIWGLSTRSEPLKQPPSEEIIAATLLRVGWRGLALSGATAFLDVEGARLDLGGIAKGYAVDVSCHKLMGSGTASVLVDLGGNMRCLGRKENGEPWMIAVRNPFRPDESLGMIPLEPGEAVSTSGNYERFVTIGRRRYAHILDPRTGSPVQDMASVTVVSHSAAEADALSTALFVLGKEDGRIMLEKTASRAAMFIPDKKPIEIWVTPEFARRFRPAAELSERVFQIGD